MSNRIAFAEAKTVTTFSSWATVGQRLLAMAFESAALYDEALLAGRITASATSKRDFIYAQLVALDAVFGWNQVYQDQKIEDDVLIMLSNLVAAR